MYLGEFPVVKVVPVLGATLDQRLSGGINPHPNGIWQERRRNGGGQRLSMIKSMKQIIVKSTSLPILLHCDVIGKIQHLPIRGANRQSHLQSVILPTIFKIFAWNFVMVILMISSMKYTYNEKISSTLTTFSKISVLVTVSLIIRLKCLLDVFLDGPPEAYKRFHFIKSVSKSCSVWYLLKIKWPKSELNISLGNLWTHVPPPPLKRCVCVWGGGSYWRPWLFTWCQRQI